MIGLVFFVLFLAVVCVYLFAKWLDRWEDNLEWRHRERMEWIRRELDQSEPYDWALDLFNDIDRLPEAEAR